MTRVLSIIDINYILKCLCDENVIYKNYSIPYKRHASLNRTNWFLRLTCMIAFNKLRIVWLSVKGSWQHTQTVSPLKYMHENCKIFALKAKFSANCSGAAHTDAHTQDTAPWTCSNQTGRCVLKSAQRHCQSHPRSPPQQSDTSDLWLCLGWNLGSCSGSILNKHSTTYIIQVFCVFRHTSMHKHSLATMFREWVKRRSDKAYLIWDYASLNQVEEILTHLCVQTNKVCLATAFFYKLQLLLLFSWQHMQRIIYVWKEFLQYGGAHRSQFLENVSLKL